MRPYFWTFFGLKTPQWPPKPIVHWSQLSTFKCKITGTSQFSRLAYFLLSWGCRCQPLQKLDITHMNSADGWEVWSISQKVDQLHRVREGSRDIVSGGHNTIVELRWCVVWVVMMWCGGDVVVWLRRWTIVRSLDPWGGRATTGPRQPRYVLCTKSCSHQGRLLPYTSC